MAILKHIKSRNANYTDAIDYLLFQHGENTGKKIRDELGRSILREHYYMDGINCDPMSFDKECEITNSKFHKNKKSSDIKSHHYIISFDPADVTECGLTGKKTQSLCLELARKIFPGYQALVVTHTDGHNQSGNIHTHIVINSVRKYSADREPYMTQPHDHEAGYKHRSTDKFLEHFKKEVMDMCLQEGLHQIDLLSPAEKKITQKEYMAQQSGQEKLEKTNKKILADGLESSSSVFQTQKQELRTAIKACAAQSKNFEEFQVRLLDEYHISVIEQRGRYSYLHPDRDKRITERSLGTRYGKERLEQIFLHKDPFLIFRIQSHLRLVVDRQTNVKAMQSQAYAHRIKITNLQQMANTIIYIQEHGYNSQQDLKKQLSQMTNELEKTENLLKQYTAELETVNLQIRYTGQYFAHKELYSQFLKSKNKGKFRKEHSTDIQAYEDARDWLKSFYPDGKMHSMNIMKSQKKILLDKIQSQKISVQFLKEKQKELETADKNVDAILQMQVPKVQSCMMESVIERSRYQNCTI